MTIRIARYFQLILGAMPVLWILFFIGYILSINSTQMMHNIINYFAFVLFIIAFNSIWIWLLFTTAISIFLKKIIYEKLSLTIFVIGSIGLILIVSFDPGSYLEKLLD
jgi:hypothetical protein